MNFSQNVFNITEALEFFLEDDRFIPVVSMLNEFGVMHPSGRYLALPEGILLTEI